MLTSVDTVDGRRVVLSVVNRGPSGTRLMGRVDVLTDTEPTRAAVRELLAAAVDHRADGDETCVTVDAAGALSVGPVALPDGYGRRAGWKLPVPVRGLVLAARAAWGADR